jgi:hypothetical protein
MIHELIQTLLPPLAESDNNNGLGTSAVIQIVSGLLALVSVSGGIFTAIRSGKDRKERDADRQRIDAEREKLGAEEDKIKTEAAEIAVRTLRRELDAAYKDIERRRTIMQTQDERIDEQDKTIRKQARRLYIIEDYIIETRKAFTAKGIEMPPVPDEFYDRNGDTREDDRRRQQQQQSGEEAQDLGEEQERRQQQQFQRPQADEASS